MSRGHMLYKESSLTSLPVKITTWNSSWDEDEVFRRTSGGGLILEGVLQSRSKHTVVDGVDSGRKFRYMVLYVKITSAVHRKYDTQGKEIEPDIGARKVTLTGYLSARQGHREAVDLISPDKVPEMIRISEMEKLTLGENCGLSNVVGIWCEEKGMEGKELEDGSVIRLRTRGTGPFLESVTCLKGDTMHTVNYTSADGVGGSWTDKVLTAKDDVPHEGAHLTDDSCAVADDEWDD